MYSKKRTKNGKDVISVFLGCIWSRFVFRVLISSIVPIKTLFVLVIYLLMYESVVVVVFIITR